MSLRLSFLVFAGCLAVGAFGQGYVGADGALKMIAAPERPKPLKAVDPAGAFWRTVGAYIRSQTKLSSKVSAARWIALAERCPSAEAIWELDDSSESLFPEVIAALPGPSVWPEIERQLKEQVDKKPEARDVALLALAETLGGKSDAAWNLVGGIKGLGPEQAVLLTYVEVALALREGNKDRIEQAYRREADAYSGRTQPIGGDKIMNLPDLSVILGPSRARSLLADIFRTFDGEVNIERGDAFKKMAREVALAGAAKLKHPQWTLALDPDAGPLFEAMHRQFPDVMRGTQRNAGWSSDTYSAAAADYMIYLVAHGRVDDATAFVKHQNSAYWYWQVPENETSYLAKLGKTDDFIKFLEAMIQGGKTTLLQDYSDFCREIGQSEREKQFVAQLPEATRAAQRDPTYEQVLDLASKGQIEQACSLLVKRLEAPDALKSISNSAPNSASQLFDIGQFLHRKDYTDLALKVGEEAIRIGDDMFIQGWVWQALLEQNRGPEAERIVADSLQRAAHSSVSPPGGKEQYEALIQIYAKAGRWADVVTMLEDAPNWGVTDVAFLNDSMKRENAVPFIAARALAGVGRKQEALRVLLFVLNAQPDLDQAYELLLSLDPKGAETILDRMHRTSPMATRPLMWKAKLLQNESRLADAEALIRQAIAIDPQDTRAWQSDTRFQAWAILAGIERAEGKAEAAAIHQRKFDTKYKYYTNNGSSRWSLEVDAPGDRMKGLADNPDDFLLRFAVADDLRTAGKSDEAEVQYVKAWRSMAEQLGEAGQNLRWYRNPQYDAEAEKALEDEFAKGPKRSGGYCALAELYASAQKPDDAERVYLQALAVDPNSLAAWEGLALLEREIELPTDLASKVALNQVRLAPADMGYAEPRANSYSALWTTAEQAVKDAIFVPEPVFTLTASASQTPDSNYQGDWERRHSWPPTPGMILGSEEAIHSFSRFISTLSTVSRAGGPGK